MHYTMLCRLYFLGYTSKKWKTKTFKASGTKLVIKKLKKGKKYQVRIRAVKHNGLVSKYSKTKTGKKIK